MKKAVFLTVDFPPALGGMARHSLDVASALAKAGVGLAVVAPSAGGGEETDGSRAFQVRRLRTVEAGHVFDNYIYSVMAYFLCGMRLAMVHRASFLAANTWSVAGVAALLIKRITGIPYAVFAHGLDVYAPQKSPKAKRLMDAVLEGASAVIANSRFTHSIVREATTRARVAVVNPMVDPRRLTAAAERCTSGRLPRKGPGGGHVILTVARLVESKGQDLVIRALPAIAARFPDALYVMVGGGPREEELRSLAARLGVGDRVLFMGEVGDEEAAACFSSADVFVLTSRQVVSRGEVEGFGIAFLEAGVFAKPVIGSRSGGIADAVIDQMTGIMVDPEDPEQIAEAVMRLFADKGLASSLGEAGRTRAVMAFGPEAFAGKLGDVIEMVTNP
jgi:phosphatidylinositol alpha-1,6-mannosyltransferase